ncbi:hypothetical protein CaCOL14_003992 [Colletotrichum acutatum]
MSVGVADVDDDDDDCRGRTPAIKCCDDERITGEGAQDHLSYDYDDRVWMLPARTTRATVRARCS